MLTISIIVLVIIIIAVISKSNKKQNSTTTKPTITINVVTSTDNHNTITDNENYNIPIKKVKDGWIINPKMPFELTVLTSNNLIAQQIRDLCDKGDYDSIKELIAIFAAENIKIKEIEDYKNKYADIYFKRIEV